MNFTSQTISATCIEYTFGNTIEKTVNDKVLNVYTALPKLLDLQKEGIIDLVPSYASLAIHFDTSCVLLHNPQAYDTLIKEALNHNNTATPITHTIKVDYSGEDMHEVCQTLHLSKQELIALHTRAYSIAMIGFREYFPYLLGLDEKLHLPRRNTPRAHVKKGSVAIAAGQTGIYPEDSPGGWHIIGYTDFDGFQTLKPSDIIIFKESHAD